MKHIYDVLREQGAKLDSHESDLYVKFTPETREIVNAYYHRGDICEASTFRDQIDGAIWYAVPFAYKPFWDKRGLRVSCNVEANLLKA
jgi:uncharacterized membrane protein